MSIVYSPYICRVRSAIATSLYNTDTKSTQQYIVGGGWGVGGYNRVKYRATYYASAFSIRTLYIALEELSWDVKMHSLGLQWLPAIPEGVLVATPTAGISIAGGAGPALQYVCICVDTYNYVVCATHVSHALPHAVAPQLKRWAVPSQ